jgi:hypothetical protein
VEDGGVDGVESLDVHNGRSKDAAYAHDERGARLLSALHLTACSRSVAAGLKKVPSTSGVEFPCLGPITASSFSALTTGWIWRTRAVAPSLLPSLAFGPPVTVRWDVEPWRSTSSLLGRNANV